MKIFTVRCEEGCQTKHFTASRRAEAAKTAHYICTGHESATGEIEVAA